MSKLAAATRSAQAYRFVARILVLSLLLQGLVPPSGLGAPVAHADGEPPLPVSVIEPEAPPPAAVTPVDPGPIQAVPPDASLIPIPDTAAQPVPPAPALPPAEYTLGPVPFALALRAETASALPGQAITYSLVLTNLQSTPLVLSVRVALPGLARWRGGAGLPPAAIHAGGLVTASLVLAPRAVRRYTFATELQGLPGSEQLAQELLVGVRGQRVLTATRALVRTPHVEARGTAGPAGGRLSSTDGRVTVDFPAAALSQTTDLVFHPDYQYAFNPALSRLFLAFTLDARVQGSGLDIHRFNRAARLTLRVGDLAGAQPFYLYYWNADTRAWETVAGPLTADPQTGTVTAEIDHFTPFGGGDISKTGWRLLYNEARPALYSGDVAASVPLEGPAGIQGLQPPLTLSYSSARAKHLTSWIQSDLAGLGTSLDAVEITRRIEYGGLGAPYRDPPGNYFERCEHEAGLCFRNQYSLLFNSAAYDLIPNGDGTYRTENDQFLRIEQVTTRIYTLTTDVRLPTGSPTLCPRDPSEPEDSDHQPLEGGYATPDEDAYWTHHYACTYWQVTAQNGTVYRLGAHRDSEQRHGRVCIGFFQYSANPHPCGGDPGYPIPGDYWDLVGPVVYRWRLDRATDAFGNRMEYHYREETASAQYEWGNLPRCPWTPGDAGWCYNLRADQGYSSALYALWDRASYLEWIGYDWRTDQATPFWGFKIVFDRSCRADPRGHLSTSFCADNGGPVLAHDGGPLPGEIGDADAEFGGNASTLWWQLRYLSGVRVLQLQSPTTARVVREYRFGYGTSGTRTAGQLPSRVLASVTPYGEGGAGGGRGALPATTFTYQALNEGGFEYGRLQGLDNGYGARSALTWFAIGDGHNYRVATKTVTDTVNPAQYTQYDYGLPCYGHTHTDGALYCNGWNDPNIVGYGLVTETVRAGGSGGPVLGATAHTYYPEGGAWAGAVILGQGLAQLAGTDRLTRQLGGASGPVRAETRTTSSVTITLDLSGDDEVGQPKKDAVFVRQDESVQSQYDAGGVLLVQTRSASVYELTYGKVITTFDYGATRVLPHAGFEEGLVWDSGATMNVPVGWLGYHNTGPASAIQVATLPRAAVLGNAGLSLTAVAGQSCQCGIKQQVTGLTPNTTYAAYVRVRTASGSPYFQLWLNEGATHHTTSLYPASSWQVISTTIASGASGSFWLMLGVYPESGAGTAYADDVWVEPLADTGDERVSTTAYVSPDVSQWIVALPRETRTYTGTWPTGSPAARATTAYTSKGLLRAQGAWAGVASGPVYTTTYEYDAWGNAVVMTDTRGYTSTAQYDGIYHSYVMTTTNALGQTSYRRYDFGRGAVISATSPNGVETGLIYDAFGRLAKVIEDENAPGAGPRDTALQPTLQYTYTDHYVSTAVSPPLIGLRVETVWREQSGTPNVKRQLEFYTGRGLLLQTRADWGNEGSPGQAVGNVVYDAVGRAVTNYTPVAQGYGYDYTAPDTSAPQTQTQYDILGRTVIVTGTDGMTTTTRYAGLVTVVRDAAGHQKLSQVDAAGQLGLVKEYAGTYSAPSLTATAYATTTYAYNVLGNLVRVTDAATPAHVTTMTYNALGQKLSMNDPDMQQWFYTYDAAGNLRTQRDAQQAYTCFYYLRPVWERRVHGADQTGAAEECYPCKNQ